MQQGNVVPVHPSFSIHATCASRQSRSLASLRGLRFEVPLSPPRSGRVLHGDCRGEVRAEGHPKPLTLAQEMAVEVQRILTEVVVTRDTEYEAAIAGMRQFVAKPM